MTVGVAQMTAVAPDCGRERSTAWWRRCSVGVHDQQVTAARKAASDLAQAVERLGRVYPASVDLRRLSEDVSRIPVDLDLLTGTAPAGRGAAQRGPHTLEVIPDGEYP